MTTPSQQPLPPIVPVLPDDDTGPATGDGVVRDSDGTPVGRDDLRADVERSGGDPDDV
ncbi:hypothetical protein Daura_18355 [Dactylosporangium aurantiacum]|uniref:Uncharacterized protein n=1 Tax=Dactylosporangium aurantiacum TaxID=35754 RepID=A0A9Q9MQV9_9ACTN|nr:hypothetical protein [Dactylosporangium aurantiacum]MDG6105867.1 hypothetical protein [Dactylosporangium aurantiacum]UWZ57957.1 hypothetical protein Daura_18355 [Dactylosporangium aurantiacum]